MDAKEFNERLIDKTKMSKTEMYNALHDRVVECVYIKNCNGGTFVLKDIQNGRIYVIDENCG